MLESSAEAPIPAIGGDFATDFAADFETTDFTTGFAITDFA